MSDKQPATPPDVKTLEAWADEYSVPPFFVAALQQAHAIGREFSREQFEAALAAVEGKVIG